MSALVGLGRTDELQLVALVELDFLARSEFHGRCSALLHGRRRHFSIEVFD